MQHSLPSWLLKILNPTWKLMSSLVPAGDYLVLIWAAVAGATGALATLVFRQGIAGLEWLVDQRNFSVVEIAQNLPWFLRVLLPTFGGLVAGGILVLAQRYARGGPSDYMESIAFGDGQVPVRQTLLRSLSSLITIASGGSIGREGSMVQLAALCASIIGRAVHFNADRLRLLVACGAAAGITAAYNAPIAGAFFIAEVVLGVIEMHSFGPLLVASIVANITMRALPDYHSTYEMPPFPAIPDVELLAFAGLGIVAGLVAPQFLRLLDFSRKRFRNTPTSVPVRLGLGGLGVGIISIWVPQVWGNGYEVVNSLLNSPWAWSAVLSILVFKVVATAFTAGSGAVGGVFTPMLFVGAASGSLFGQGVGALWPHTAAPFAYAIAGMGAFLAVATSAPIMAVLMTFEMTLSAQALLPLVLTCLVAYFVALPSSSRAMYSVTLQHRHNRQTRDRLRKLCVKDLLKPAQTVLPLTAPFIDVVQMLKEHEVKYVYIVNEANWFCGVIHTQAVTAALADGWDTTSLKATDLLQRDFLVLLENQGIEEALQAFLSHQGERLPVVTSSQQPVLLGVVYKSSLLDAYYHLHQPLL